MVPNSSQLPTIDAWRAQVLRLTIFPSRPEDSFEQEWWQELVGEEPEVSTRKRLLRTDEGPLGEKTFTLMVDPAWVELSFGRENRTSLISQEVGEWRTGDSGLSLRRISRTAWSIPGSGR